MARSKAATGTITYFNVLLRYYLHVDPDTLSDEQWADHIAYLEKIRTQEKHSSL